MKLLFLLLFIPFLNSPVRYRQLTWADYKGNPTNNHLASTCSGIVIEKDIAYAIFEPDRSWTRTNDPAVLRHEQVHFLITEYYARIINNVDRRIVNWYLDKWNELEERYDLDTDHGRNEKEQKVWEEMYKF